MTGGHCCPCTCRAALPLHSGRSKCSLRLASRRPSGQRPLHRRWQVVGRRTMHAPCASVARRRPAQRACSLRGQGGPQPPRGWCAPDGTAPVAPELGARSGPAPVQQPVEGPPQRRVEAAATPRSSDTSASQPEGSRRLTPRRRRRLASVWPAADAESEVCVNSSIDAKREAKKRNEMKK